MLIVSAILAGIIFVTQKQNLRIIFLDVGQGDAILISQGRNQILIDGGVSGQVLLGKLGEQIPFWDRKIELVVATHPDQDHIGGLIAVLENYQIGVVLDNGQVSETGVYEKYRAIIQKKQIRTVWAQRGVRVKLGQAAMEILSPDDVVGVSTNDSNLASVVAKLKFGENSFLFTGDLPFAGETQLLTSGANLSAQVLKVAHHGSKSSTSVQFLDAISPRDAVISVGAQNRYGHPTPEVLDRLKNKSIQIFRTDEVGDVEYDCQGINLECQITLVN